MTMMLHTLLFRAYHAQTRMLSPLLEELGLGRGQPKILNYLINNGECTQNEVASYFKLDPASISRMVETMSKKGFISVEMDSQCRRRNILKITEKGTEAIKKWQDGCRKTEEKMLNGFTSEERNMLVELLQKAYYNMEGGSVDGQH